MDWIVTGSHSPLTGRSVFDDQGGAADHQTGKEIHVMREVPSKGLEWTNLILGAGLACAAFAFGELPVVAWHAAIVGTLAAACSAIALYRYADWAECSNLALGCWAVVAPFLLGFGSVQAAMWTHVLLGACIATIAGVQLAASRRARVPSGTRPTDPR